MLQSKLGLDLTSLVEDMHTTTIETIISEAIAQLQILPVENMPQTNVHVTTFPMPQTNGLSSADCPQWIAPAPVSIKMRLFCIPYAGGVSENVFGR